MRTVIVSVLAVVALSLPTLSQPIAMDWNTIGQSEYVTRQAVKSNSAYISLVLKVLGQELRKDNASYVAKYNAFLGYFSDPSATDACHQEAISLIALAKGKNAVSAVAMLRAGVIDLYVKSDITSPVAFTTPRAPTAAPKNLLDSCIANAKILLPTAQKDTQLQYGISTFQIVCEYDRSVSAENRLIAKALKDGKDIKAAKKFATKMLKKSEIETELANGY